MTPDDDAARFDAVRSKCPNQTECGEMSRRAQDEAWSLRLHEPNAGWEVEAAAWQRLADAAYVCETILVRRALSFTRGTPPETNT